MPVLHGMDGLNSMLDTQLPDRSSPRHTETQAAMPSLNRRALVGGLVLALLAMLSAECLRIFVGSNFHDVVPAKCYRSAQPTPAFLENLQRTHSIRSIVNLRDENKEESWYNHEKEAADRHGIQLINAGLCSIEQPPEHDFARFIQAIKDAPEPVLIHCANGNDRTGLASAVYLLMRTHTPLAQARGQLSLRYGHFGWTRSSCLRRILDSYENWLQETGKEHHPDHLYDWGMHFYRQEKR